MKVLQNIKNFFKKNEQIIVYTASALSLLCAFIIIGSLIVFSINNNKSTPTTPTEAPTTLSASNTETTTGSETDTTNKNQDETTTKPSDKEDVTTKEEETTTTDEEETTKKDALPYLIEVNTALNCITIYTKDAYGKYTVPHKAMICSTGQSGAPTPLGSFKLGDIHSWTKIANNEHVQCAIKFNGPYMFQTVTYSSMKNGTLNTEAYNKLGENSTSGNIMLTVEDMLWIRKNCPTNTPIEIYSDASLAGPLGKPEAIKIPLDSPNKNWDPTDPGTDNPWKNLKPTIKADSNNITIGYGATKEQFLSYFTILDTCGNDASNIVKINGTYDLNKAGQYNITLSVTDALNRTASMNVKVTITSSKYDEKPSEEVTSEESTTETTVTPEETTTNQEETTTKEETTTNQEETTPEKNTTEESSTTDPTTSETTAEPASNEDETTTEPASNENETTTTGSNEEEAA